jgi:hypothetical protein
LAFGHRIAWCPPTSLFVWSYDQWCCRVFPVFRWFLHVVFHVVLVGFFLLFFWCLVALLFFLGSASGFLSFVLLLMLLFFFFLSSYRESYALPSYYY